MRVLRRRREKCKLSSVHSGIIMHGGSIFINAFVLSLLLTFVPAYVSLILCDFEVVNKRAQVETFWTFDLFKILLDYSI